MSKLIIPSTFKTPEINLDDEIGVLRISGRVFPENPNAYFEPIITWISEYAKAPRQETTLIFFLTYFNSSANEYLFRCCKKMEEIFQNGHLAKIVWEYESEDEDMEQMGEDYKELLKINFEIKSIK
jgi:hypothetical protein